MVSVNFFLFDTVYLCFDTFFCNILVYVPFQPLFNISFAFVVHNMYHCAISKLRSYLL